MNASGVIVGPPNGASTPSESTSSAGSEDTKLLASSNKNWLTKFVFCIACLHFCKASVFRIRIQHFRLNTGTDPDPIRIQGFDGQKLKIIYSWKKILIFF
jgi:hypothetical protein